VLFLQRFFRQARCSMPISQNIGFGDLFLWATTRGLWLTALACRSLASANNAWWLELDCPCSLGCLPPVHIFIVCFVCCVYCAFGVLCLLCIWCVAFIVCLVCCVYCAFGVLCLLCVWCVVFIVHFVCLLCVWCVAAEQNTVLVRNSESFRCAAEQNTVLLFALQRNRTCTGGWKNEREKGQLSRAKREREEKVDPRKQRKRRQHN
jgi:hypothetical protein